MYFDDLGADIRELTSILFFFFFMNGTDIRWLGSGSLMMMVVAAAMMVSFPLSMQNVPPDLSICTFVLEQSLSVRALQEMLANTVEKSEGAST